MEDDKKKKYEKPIIRCVFARDEDRYDHELEDMMADYEEDYEDEE